MLLHSSAAGSCALKTSYAFTAGLEQPPPPPAPQWSVDHRGFAAGVLAEIPEAVDLRGLRDQPVAEQEAACLRAMRDGVPVIVGGRLPDVDHRAGRPDLLVRTATGYLPGLIRAYRMFESRADDTTTTVSRLTSLGTPEALPQTRLRWRYRWHLALRLAHYHRMLASLGLAAEGAHGLLIGNDPLDEYGQVAVWVDLAEPALSRSGGQPAPSPGAPTSALERYDFEFAQRVDLARRAIAAEPAPLPVRTRECDRCAWWPVCVERLDPDDLTLQLAKLPLDAHEVTVLRRAGVTTVADLAAADLDRLLPGYLEQVGHRTGGEDRLRLAQRRAALVHSGVRLERLDSGPIDVPSAPLEIDFDLETSATERIYLWGFWVTDTRTGESSYHHVSDFRQLEPADELDLAIRALTWLREISDGAETRVYHYSAYERDQIDRLARARHHPVLEWAAGYARENFVDLFPIMREHFFGTDGLGLKVVASAGSGFAWRDPDPGGLNSMRWFSDAVGAATEPERDAARRRVLEYNEDDVRATWQLRTWLRSLT
ncbi:TM0106 family RecB-like putative nuclease [Micropruina sp.]|uniref:TM0106 family RecB-like putative nuclease n=1 Tax=Micropruina sp. TaxID=2737536 RepID=UPI00262872A4|nr:TM0106 family RecB-like putative nuclease [Micropruina sp.]